MAALGTALEFRIPSEPVPLTTVDEVGPVPSISSPDSQSFVVIKSAAELDDLSDDGDIADVSLIQEHRKLLQEELAQFESRSSLPQPLLTVPQANTATNAQDEADGELNQNNENVSGAESTSSKNTDPMNQSVLPAMPQPQICAVDPDDNAISIQSFARSDFVSEEIQTKVSQLIEENTHLKDTIIQNNLSMKAQYEKIVAWRKDVDKIHEAHKEKFRDAKNCIEKLKEDNSILRKENENLRVTLQAQQTEHDKTKRLLTETSENNLKEFELDVANKRIKELEDALQALNAKDRKAEAEKAQLKAMEEKLQRYENELENAYKKLREMEKNAADFKMTQEKLLLSEMSNERAQEEIQSLRNQLARNVQSADETTKIESTLGQIAMEKNNLLAERDQLLADIQSRNTLVMEAHMRVKQLEEELNMANDEIQRCQGSIKGLKDTEEQAKIEAWRTKQRLLEAEQKCAYLQQNFETLQQQPRPQYHPEYNPGELAYIRQQLMQSQKALTECEQNRAVAEARVAALSNENAGLKTQLDSKQTESDNEFALRAQLELYKADFEAERVAKEDFKTEKNKISEDNHLLNRRNQQLQEEVELLRQQLEQYSQHVPPRPPRPNPDQKEGYVYRCPKCDFAFNTYQALDNHVFRCIELDDSLP